MIVSTLGACLVCGEDLAPVGDCLLAGLLVLVSSANASMEILAFCNRFNYLFSIESVYFAWS